jgi:hypothetical protein
MLNPFVFKTLTPAESEESHGRLTKLPIGLLIRDRLQDDYSSSSDPYQGDHRSASIKLQEEC